MSITVASFPAPTPDATACAAALGTRGFSLRTATLDDVSFLRELYGLLRLDEVNAISWPDTAKQAFLDSQFSLQHHHFVTHYPSTDFFVIESEGTSVGRFYLMRERPYFLIVDVALLPPWRGRGLGTLLLEGAKRLAMESGAMGIDLHVDERNAAARQLYTRLGFTQTQQEGPYLGMRWTCASETQLNTA